MNDTTLMNLLHSYNQKLDETLFVNKKLLYEIQKQKSSASLNPIRNIKISGMLFGIVWTAFLIYLLVHLWSFASIFSIVSVIIHLAVSFTAFGLYVYHLNLIHQIQNSENIISNQEKLARLQVSTIDVYKISFLQLPVFETWYMSIKWMHDSPVSFWFIQVPIVILFTFLGIWLYRNIDLKNKNKKWFITFFKGKEFGNIIKASDFLKQIEDYKN